MTPSVRLWGLVALSVVSVSCASIQHALSPSSRMKIQAADGAWVACDIYDKGRDTVIVISPGFLQHKRSLGIRELIEGLSSYYDVIALDYRGTGESTGFYAYSAKEHADLHAVLQFAHRRWRRVGVIGISLGAAIAINELAEHPLAHSLATISAPMAFWEIEKQVDLKTSTVAISEASWGWGMRSDSPFLKKRDPIDQIERLTAPVLFLHGEDDRVVFPRHSRQLHDLAAGPKELVLLPNAGHAAELIVPHRVQVLETIRRWFDQTLQ